jgi:hypothetical protein
LFVFAKHSQRHSTICPSLGVAKQKYLQILAVEGSTHTTNTMDFAVRQPSGAFVMNPLTSLYQTTKSSDLTIYCRGKTYPVHRAILRARSQFFDGACRNPFKESHQGWIDLSEDDPEAVEHMITYFYNLDYLPTPRIPSAPESYLDSDLEQAQTPSLCATPTTPLSPTIPTTPTSPQRRRLNLSMIEDPLLAIAAVNQPKPSASPYLSRFGITSPLCGPEDSHLLAVKQQPETPPLMIDTMMHDRPEQVVFSYFDEDAVPEQATNYARADLVAHAKVYAIAEQYGIRDLKVLARKKYVAQISTHRNSEEFAPSLAEAYDGTIEKDRGLRDIVISTFRRFPELTQRADVEEVVRDTPGLAWELFRVAWVLPI